MRISSLFPIVAMASIFGSIIIPYGDCALAGEVMEVKGGVVSELQKLSSPMVMLQFTDRAEGNTVSHGFTYAAKIFKDSVVNFAEVDLSHASNTDWVGRNEGRTYGFAIIDPSANDFAMTLMEDVPDISAEMAAYFRNTYVEVLVFPDVDRLGMGPALQLHMPGVDAIEEVLQGSDNDNDSDNGNNDSSHGHDDTPDTTTGTSEQDPDNVSAVAAETEGAKAVEATTPPAPHHQGRQREALDDRQSSGTFHPSSLKVGDKLMRPEALASTDGSTVVSLADHASVVIKRSITCPAGFDENSMPPPHLQHCVAPSFVDGVHNDVEVEKEADELLTASKRRVRKVAEKKAAEGRNVNVKRPLRKVLGLFGHGATVRGGESVGSTGTDVKGDRPEVAHQEQEEESRTSAEDDVKGGGVPETVSRNGRKAKGIYKGKIIGGWFGWRWWGGGRKEEAALDGEVAMSVSELGSLDVTYDGVNVLSKSGPHTWEWVNRMSRFPRGRTRSNDYELRVVQDGIEMCLGHEKVWGVTVRSPCPAPDES